jgi:exopolyphosphatase/guanosine-5'-triphosphate,3'-diphosphate pyrophosphatase
MSHKPNKSLVGALIDLGTNSVRLVIVRLERDGTHVILKQEKSPVNLGEGSFKNHYLTKEAMDRTFEALENMVKTSRFFEADYVRAVATSALRQAANRDEFLSRVFKDLKLDLKVISGLEEARLVYLGVSSNLSLEERPSLIMDIGGGSVELIVKGPDTHLEIDSMPLGASRLADLFGLKNDPGLVDKDLYQAIKRYVLNHTCHFMSKAAKYGLEICHGCAGVIENLAKIQAKLLHQGETLIKYPLLSQEDLEHMGLWLGAMPLGERRKVKGLDKEKVPIIVAGCAIVDSVLGELGIKTLNVVEHGLKYGLVYDFINLYRKNGGAGTREENIRQLGRRCLYDEKHAEAVSGLSVLIYEALVRADLLIYNQRDKELLRLGALVHDIGKFLTYENHQLHSWYLIKNATLLGFDEDEIALLAFLALNHRGDKHDKFGDIYALYEKSERLDYRLFRALGLIVAMSEILESRRQDAIVGCEVGFADGKAEFDFRVKPESTLTAETAALDKLGKEFETVFGLKLGQTEYFPIQKD